MIFKYSFLLIYFLSITFNANAVPVGGVMKLFKGAGKVLKKGSDEIPDLGKKFEDLKDGKFKTTDKIDDTLRSSSEVDNAASVKYGDDTISEIEKLSDEDLLEAHDVKKLKDLDTVLDIVQNVDSAKNITETAAIIPFLERPWEGKVFKNSVFFNKPKIKDKDRILIRCKTSKEDFYFTALFDQNMKNYLLLSGNFVNKNNSLNKNKMDRQELLVLDDLENYLFFSNKPVTLPTYPKKYFIISKNAKFIVNENKDKNPDQFLDNIGLKLKKTQFSCRRSL